MTNPVSERAEPAPTSAPATRLHWPPQVKYIVGNEGCERFSFYGMRSILVVYMVQDLLLAPHDAKALFHLFVFASYLATLGGAWLADRFAGRYRTILWLSMGYVAGHAVIATFESREGLYAGLALIAVGSGGIKPCVSAFVGDQFGAEDRPFLAKVYGLFYWMVNVGAVTSSLLIPVLRREFGPHLAFAVPGLLMAIALIVFRAGRRHYLITAPTGPNPNSFLRVARHALRRLGTGRLGEHWLDVARDRFPPEAVVGTKAVFRKLSMTVLLSFFAGNSKGMEVVVQGAKALSGLEYSRQNEREADILGMELIRSARIDPQGTVQFFKRLEETEAMTSQFTPQVLKYLSTHPSTADRIRWVEDMAKKSDYEPVPLESGEDWKDAMKGCL